MNARNLTVFLVGAVALVAGLFLGVWLAGARSVARAAPGVGAPASVPATPTDLAPVLAELAGVLADLRATLAQRPAAPGSSEVPVREAVLAMPAPGDADLATALQALAASVRGLERGTERASGANAHAGLVVPAFVNRERAFAGVGLREAQDADDELAWERAMDAFRKRHLFWTTQQVLDAYGKPDEIEVGERTSTWSYRLPVEDDEETYTFYLSDGLVFSVEYSY
jgi:hypothetical protein